MICRLLWLRGIIPVIQNNPRKFCTSAVIKTNDAIKDSRPINGDAIQILDPFTPFISPQEHRQRQRRLVSTVHKGLTGCTSGAIVDGLQSTSRKVSTLILIPATKKTYQADTQIPLIHFKMNSDFIYLTGFNTVSACNCVLAIIGDSISDLSSDVGEAEDDISVNSILFVPKSDDHQLIWEGSGLLSPENEFKLNILVDEVRNVNELQTLIDTLNNQDNNRQILTTKTGLSTGTGFINPQGNQVKDISTFIDQLKVIKAESEQKCMIRTGLIGANALQSTINFSKNQLFNHNQQEFNLPLINESQISSKFDHESRLNGAVKIAYPSVCAGGQRSTVIHYGANNKFLSKNDWILMDAGCEDIEGYNSDITRCWSMNEDKNVSKLHFELYQALTEVQSDLIKKVKSSPGISLDQLFSVMCSMLGKLLIEFGAISKSSSPSEANKHAFHFCPHHVSHYLGLDVHDSPSVPRNIPLRPGMCFTVEPGLYFRSDDPNVREEFKGIGIRVEDDLLIENDGNIIVLSQKCKWIN